MRCAHERGCPLLSVPAGAFRSILLVDNKKLAALESIEPALTVRIRGEFGFFSGPQKWGIVVQAYTKEGAAWQAGCGAQLAEAARTASELQALYAENAHHR